MDMGDILREIGDDTMFDGIWKCSFLFIKFRVRMFGYIET